MCPLPELGGRNALFLFKEGGELAGILEFQAVGNLRDIQVGAGEQFFGSE